MTRIQISKDPSGRIIVSFPYDPVLVSKVKTIEGRRRHPAEKHVYFLKPQPSPLVARDELGRIGGGQRLPHTRYE